MLANGIKLGFKTDGAASVYTNLTGLKEVPEMGNSKEKVENTSLADQTKQYEFGIGDYGDLAYKFKYENEKTTSPYRVLRGYEKLNTVLYFEEEFPDGTKFAFQAQVATKLGGAGVNGVIDFTLTMALQSDIEVTDPTA